MTAEPERVAAGSAAAEMAAAGSAAGPLGVLAAAGPLPVEVAASVVAAGRAAHIVAIEGFAGDAVGAFPHDWVSLGQINRMLGAFRRAGCREIVIAGAMQRPDLRGLKFDLGFVRHLPTILKLMRGGDDSALRRVVRFFEAQGFVVRGAAEVAPHLLATSGVIGRRAPTEPDRRAIERAARLIHALGPFDIGQAAVATAAGIVAIEGVRGTDAMLRDLGPGGVGDGLGAGGVLVKLAKPGQEMRVDLPTIGTATVERAVAAGLAGIAVGAGAAIVLDKPAVATAADAASIFVAGIKTADVLNAADDTTSAAAPLERMLEVVSRRAPTLGERRDIGVARRLLPVLAREGAGNAAVIASEHVLAIAGKLPIGDVIRPLAERSHWGLRRLKGRIGTLALDLSTGASGAMAVEETLNVELFRAARDAGLAGIVCFGASVPEAHRVAVAAWANEARLFLMTEAP